MFRLPFGHDADDINTAEFERMLLVLEKVKNESWMGVWYAPSALLVPAFLTSPRQSSQCLDMGSYTHSMVSRLESIVLMEPGWNISRWRLPQTSLYVLIFMSGDRTV